MIAPQAGGEEGSAERRSTVSVTVVLDEAHRSATDSVCARLQAQGMHIEQVLALLGLVTGRLPADRMTAARQVEGVIAVEVQRDHRVPPPGAPVQ